MTVTDLQKQAAFSAGQHAAVAGLPLSGCPYDATAEPVLALWYVRGYQGQESGAETQQTAAVAADSVDLEQLEAELGLLGELLEFTLDAGDVDDFNRKHPRGLGGRFGHSNALFNMLKAKAAGAGVTHGDDRIEFDGPGDPSMEEPDNFGRYFDWSTRKKDLLARGGQTHTLEIEGPTVAEQEEDDEGNIISQQWEQGGVQLRELSDGDMRDLTNMIGTALLRKQLNASPFEGTDPRTPYLVAMMDLQDHNTWRPQETTYDHRVSIFDSPEGWSVMAEDDDGNTVEFLMSQAEMEALYGQMASYLLTPHGRENENQTAGLSGAALKRFNDLHDRGFGGKFGHKGAAQATAAKVKGAVQGDSGGVEEVAGKARAAAGKVADGPSHRRPKGTIGKAIASGQPDALADFKRPALLKAVKDRNLIMTGRKSDQDLRDMLMQHGDQTPAGGSARSVREALANNDEASLKKFGKRALVAETRRRGLAVGDPNKMDVEELRNMLIDAGPEKSTSMPDLADELKKLPKSQEGEQQLRDRIAPLKVAELRQLRAALAERGATRMSGTTKKQLQNDIAEAAVVADRDTHALRTMKQPHINEVKQRARDIGIDMTDLHTKQQILDRIAEVESKRAKVHTSKMNAHSLTAGDEVLVDGQPHRVFGHQQKMEGGKLVVELTLIDKDGRRKRRTYGMNDPLERVVGGRTGGSQTAAAGHEFSDDDWAAASMNEFDITRMPPRLVKYWLGEGAVTHGIAWCTRGSFRRARKALLKEGVPLHMVNGATANLYRMACGKSPGRHGGEHSMPDATLAAAAATQVACGCGDMHNPADMPSAINIFDDYGYDELEQDLETAVTEEDDDGIDDTPMYASPLPDDAPSTSKGWRGPLAPINIATGDRRRIAAGALSTRMLPLPFRWQERQEKGHDGAVVVGALTGYSIAPDGTIMGEGYWLDPDIIPQVRAAMHLVEHKVVGPSIDLEPNMDVQYIDADTGETFQPHECHEAGTCPARAEALITNATITGATLVPITAFAEVRAPELFDRTMADDRDVIAHAYVASQVAAVRRSGWDDLPIAGRDREFDKGSADANITAWARIGAEAGSPEFWNRYARAFLWADDPATTKGAFKFPVCDVIDGELTIVPHAVFNAAARVDSSTIPTSGKNAVRDVIEDLYGQMADEFDDQTMRAPWERDHEMSSGAAADCGCAGKWANAVTAAATQTAAADIVPFDVFAGMDPYPADAFNVKVDRLTPITIEQRPGENFARVFGHAFSWKSCNRGFKGVCVPAPKGDGTYSQFHLGAVRTDQGLLPVGKIVQGEGHPDTGTGARIARAFYDRTSKTTAFVRARNDEFGGLIAGVLAPGVTAEEATMLLASPPSGDWKAGELIAVLAVNVPGHVVPRATWQDGQPVNMVAAGSFWLEDADELAEFHLMQAGFAVLAEQMWADEADTLAATFKAE